MIKKTRELDSYVLLDQEHTMEGFRTEPTSDGIFAAPEQRVSREGYSVDVTPRPLEVMPLRLQEETERVRHIGYGGLESVAQTETNEAGSSEKGSFGRLVNRIDAHVARRRLDAKSANELQTAQLVVGKALWGREARFDDVVVEQDMSREEVINRLGQPHLHSAGVSDRLEDIMSQLEGNDAQLLRDASHTVGLVRRAGLAQLYAPPTAALDMLSNSDRYS